MTRRRQWLLSTSVVLSMIVAWTPPGRANHYANTFGYYVSSVRANANGQWAYATDQNSPFPGYNFHLRKQQTGSTGVPAVSFEKPTPWQIVPSSPGATFEVKFNVGPWPWPSTVDVEVVWKPYATLQQLNGNPNFQACVPPYNQIHMKLEPPSGPIKSTAPQVSAQGQEVSGVFSGLAPTGKHTLRITCEHVWVGLGNVSYIDVVGIAFVEFKEWEPQGAALQFEKQTHPQAANPWVQTGEGLLAWYSLPGPHQFAVSSFPGTGVYRVRGAWTPNGPMGAGQNFWIGMAKFGLLSHAVPQPQPGPTIDTSKLKDVFGLLDVLTEQLRGLQRGGQACAECPTLLRDTEALKTQLRLGGSDPAAMRDIERLGRDVERLESRLQRERGMTGPVTPASPGGTQQGPSPQVVIRTPGVDPRGPAQSDPIAEQLTRDLDGLVKRLTGLRDNREAQDLLRQVQDLRRRATAGLQAAEVPGVQRQVDQWKAQTDRIEATARGRGTVAPRALPGQKSP